MIKQVRTIFKLQVLQAAEGVGFDVPEDKMPEKITRVRRVVDGKRQKLVLHKKSFSIFEEMPIASDGYRKLLQYP